MLKSIKFVKDSLKEISTLFGEWVWPNWWADDRWPAPTQPMHPPYHTKAWVGQNGTIQTALYKTKAAP